MTDLNAALKAAILKALIDSREETTWRVPAEAVLDAVRAVLDEIETPRWCDEWQVMHRHYGDVNECGSCWSTCGTEEEARRDAAQAVSEGSWGEVWIQHRRVAATAWERVPDA